KPGVCPRRQYTAEMCARISFALCADDSDCTKDEKCCNNGCGRQCMAPVAGILYYIVLYCIIILYYIILQGC
ncbi:hypothetical protein ABG768_015898, partial [Culter alburnus]